MPGPLGSMAGYSATDAPAPPEAAAATRTPAEEPAADRGQGRHGRLVARSAGSLVDKKRLIVDGQSYRFDCSGMVMAAYAGAGYRIGGGSRDLHAKAQSEGLLHKRRRPHPGDIAFFDNTYDRNRNGRRDDPLTHVGVVESVDAAGTITVVHLGSSGVGRLKMNLDRPGDAAVNSPLRSTSGRDGGPVLAGQLWRDFGSLWKMAPSG